MKYRYIILMASLYACQGGSFLCAMKKCCKQEKSVSGICCLEDKCNVCLEAYETMSNDRQICVLRCGHSLCKSCFDAWKKCWYDSQGAQTLRLVDDARTLFRDEFVCTCPLCKAFVKKDKWIATGVYKEFKRPCGEALARAQKRRSEAAKEIAQEQKTIREERERFLGANPVHEYTDDEWIAQFSYLLGRIVEQIEQNDLSFQNGRIATLFLEGEKRELADRIRRVERRLATFETTLSLLGEEARTLVDGIMTDVTQKVEVAEQELPDESEERTKRLQLIASQAFDKLGGRNNLFESLMEVLDKPTYVSLHGRMEETMSKLDEVAEKLERFLEGLQEQE